eukprot:TRINITY_DN112215_c0_g1_i1.p1 TRINITY_DN112215_c0_g1~~TRINITY_DN112215_c0_g1_i1.p1  ORF type:complete len:341 (+),score=78.02 TRINITY_DN112215_c0_g1_i1:87-1109(+)
MAVEGFTVKKKHIFLSCASISTIGFVIFLIFVIATAQMHGAISGICNRMDSSMDMQCRVSPMEKSTAASVTCDASCKQDWSSALGGAGSAPGIYGVGEWSEQGIPKEDDDSVHKWEALVRPGTPCTLNLHSDNLWKAAVNCGCERNALRVLMQGPQGHTYEEGCTIVTWDGGDAWLTAGEVSVPCLYIPSDSSIKPEIAVGFDKETEIQRCNFGLDRFSTGGHYFVIYMPCMILWCWCGLISCVGYGDQLYQARRRLTDKKSLNYSGGAAQEEPSAAVMAAQEWAQTQAYGAPHDPSWQQQGYDQQGYDQQQGGYDQSGYDQTAYDQSGYNQQEGQYNQA